MEPTSRTEVDVARAEGEGMNFVPPPEVPRPKRMLLSARVTLHHLLSLVPERQRVSLVAGIVATGVAVVARRLHIRGLGAASLAAGAGIVASRLLKKRPVGLLPPEAPATEVVP